METSLLNYKEKKKILLTLFQGWWINFEMGMWKNDFTWGTKPRMSLTSSKSLLVTMTGITNGCPWDNIGQNDPPPWGLGWSSWVRISQPERSHIWAQVVICWRDGCPLWPRKLQSIPRLMTTVSPDIFKRPLGEGGHHQWLRISALEIYTYPTYAIAGCDCLPLLLN